MYFFFVGGLVLLGVFFLARLWFRERQELVKLIGEARLVREDLHTLMSEITCTTEEMLGALEKKMEQAPDLLHLPSARAVGDGLSAAVSPLPARRKQTKEQRLQVYRMTEEGLSVREIAEGLNMGQGEVKLILNLKQS